MEYVVLVNEADEPVGTAPKAEVHTLQTPRHRAFSAFIFNSKGEVLLQQRAKHKKTWGGAWSNSCCGHPGPGESYEQAAKRRLRQELGLTIDELVAALPDYRYRAEKDGVVENEICPVFVGFTDQEPQINRDEVETVRWVPWTRFVEQVKTNPSSVSPWCVEETLLLDKNPHFNNLFRQNVS